MDCVELWRHLLFLLLKSMPTPSRALWTGAQHREVEIVQGQLWKHGLVWVLGHPQLLMCLWTEEERQAEANKEAVTTPRSDLGAGATPAVTTPRGSQAAGASPVVNAPSQSAAFWGWIISEMTSLA